MNILDPKNRYWTYELVAYKLYKQPMTLEIAVTLVFLVAAQKVAYKEACQ